MSHDNDSSGGSYQRRPSDPRDPRRSGDANDRAQPHALSPLHWLEPAPSRDEGRGQRPPLSPLNLLDAADRRAEAGGQEGVNNTEPGAASEGTAPPGRAIDAAARAGFGDVSGARIHTGGSADARTAAHGARALTVGRDIHFAPGEYQPDTDAGASLLGHELAHVAQQRGGDVAIAAKLRTTTSGETAEVEADRAADVFSAALAGDDVQPVTLSATPPQLARQATGDDKTPKRAVAMRVHVRMRDGTVKDWSGATAIEDIDGARFVAERQGDRWEWDDDRGASVRVLTNPRGRGGSLVEQWAGKDAIQIVVDFGTRIADAIPEGRGTGGAGGKADRSTTAIGDGNDKNRGIGAQGDAPGAQPREGAAAGPGDRADTAPQDTTPTTEAGTSDAAAPRTGTDAAASSDDADEFLDADLIDDEAVTAEIDQFLSEFIEGGGQGADLDGSPDGRTGADTRADGQGRGGPDARSGGAKAPQDQTLGSGDNEATPRGPLDPGGTAKPLGGDGRSGGGVLGGSNDLFGIAITIPAVLKGVVEVALMIDDANFASLGPATVKKALNEVTEEIAERAARKAAERAVQREVSKAAAAEIRSLRSEIKVALAAPADQLTKRQRALVKTYGNATQSEFQAALRKAHRSAQRKAVRPVLAEFRKRAKAAKVAKQPRNTAYSPRDTLDNMDAQYPGQVTPGTVLRKNEKNAKLAGKRHPDTGIVFDDRGFPIFDDVAKFDTRIPSGAVAVQNRKKHMRAASTQLDESIRRGEVSASRFTKEQLVAIRAHEPHIPGYAWHHHQEVGRMQLVPEDIHARTGHAGGFDVWY